MGVAPYPLYTDGTDLYTSFDGGATLLPLGGEAATSYSAAPVSGNGTVGTPFTIASGAIGLPNLATQAANTFVANGAGGSASPTAITAAAAAALLPAATASLPGLLTAAQFQELKGLSGWFATQAYFLFSNFGALTEVAGAKFGPTPTLLQTITGADSNVTGGGVQSASGVVTRLSTVSVFQNPATVAWGVVMRAKWSAVDATVQSMGIINNAASHNIEIILDTAFDATHWKAFNGGGSGSVVLSVADTAWHDFALTSDATTLGFWVDGVSVGTLAIASTSLSDEPMWPFINSAGSPLKITKAIWGYVAP